MAKINPFDIIKTTKDIPANVIINREAPYTQAINIILPKGSLLFSNTHNYGLQLKAGGKKGNFLR